MILRIGYYTLSIMALVLGLIISVALVVLTMLYYAIHFGVDEGHAASYFSGKIRYENVLASRNLHSVIQGENGCVFSIVELAHDAPSEPEGRDRDLEWSGERSGWQQTPFTGLREIGHRHGKPDDALAWCYEELPQAAASRIVAAVRDEGSYYVRTGPRGEFKVYSKPQNVAGYVRVSFE